MADHDKYAQVEPRNREPNPALRPLEVLVGDWKLESPLFAGRSARVTFEWLEGGAFLVHHSAQNTTMIIGRDDALEAYSVLYYDERGVSRIYAMSLEGGVWKLWRNAPGFWQRFSGTLSDDTDTITARWEKSSDGAQWEHDFDLTYSRVTSAPMPAV